MLHHILTFCNFISFFSSVNLTFVNFHYIRYPFQCVIGLMHVRYVFTSNDIFCCYTTNYLFIKFVTISLVGSSKFGFVLYIQPYQLIHCLLKFTASFIFIIIKIIIISIITSKVIIIVVVIMAVNNTNSMLW